MRQRVLAHLKSHIHNGWRNLQRELQALSTLRGKPPTLAEFLHEQGLELTDVYRETKPSGWASLRRAAGLLASEPGPEEDYFSQRFTSLCHRDAPNQIDALRLAAERAAAPHAPLSPQDLALLQMLAYQVDGQSSRVGGPAQFLARLGRNPEAITELRQLADVLEVRSTLPSVPLPGLETTPLLLHGQYSRREIQTAVGWLTDSARPAGREGVLRLKEQRMELLFVTLDKSSGYHATVSYHDYAMSSTRFHWQSQNSTAPETPIGQQYLASPGNGWRFQLFVRADRASPFIACGPVTLVESTGARPMNIVWQLQAPMPARRFREFSVLRAA